MEHIEEQEGNVALLAEHGCACSCCAGHFYISLQAVGRGRDQECRIPFGDGRGSRA